MEKEKKLRLFGIILLGISLVLIVLSMALHVRYNIPPLKISNELVLIKNLFLYLLLIGLATLVFFYETDKLKKGKKAVYTILSFSILLGVIPMFYGVISIMDGFSIYRFRLNALVLTPFFWIPILFYVYMIIKMQLHKNKKSKADRIAELEARVKELEQK